MKNDSFSSNQGLNDKYDSIDWGKPPEEEVKKPMLRVVKNEEVSDDIKKIAEGFLARFRANKEVKTIKEPEVDN